MSHVLHQLADEFPEYKQRIHELKISDSHFSRFFDEYHIINREIHRAEALGGNISDEALEDLKKQRLNLKDQLFQMIKT